MIQFSLGTISWEAIAAIATFAAVGVALVPVWQEARRRRAHAINLRIRIGSHLTVLRPTLGSMVQHTIRVPIEAVMSKEQFAETVRSIESLLAESSVLNPVEQDLLNTAFLHLQTAVLIYGSPTFTVDEAKKTLGMLDRALLVIRRGSNFRRKTRKLLQEEKRSRGVPSE